MKIEKVPGKDRGILRPIINRGTIYDALAAYYAFDHPESQVDLFSAFSAGRNPVGFVARARTGMDLFRPLLVPFVAQPDVLNSLLAAAVVPERPVLLMLPVEQWSWLDQRFTLSQESRMDVYRLDPISYQPVINVLVQSHNSPSGFPRYEIRHQGVSTAAAGVNWAGERFVEVYIDLVDNPRELEYGRSVLAALSELLLSRGMIPLLRLEDDFAYRKIMLEEVGFQRTGVRLMMAQVVLGAAEKEL